MIRQIIKTFALCLSKGRLDKLYFDKLGTNGRFCGAVL